MFFLYAFMIAVASPIAWILNAEAVAVFAGLFGSRPWPLVALTLAAGQCLTFSLLFVGGEGLARRVGPFRRQIDRLRAEPVRWERYRRAAGWWLAAAAGIGFPPLVAMAALAPALGVSYRMFALIALGGRTARFFVFAGLPTLFADFLPMDAIPDWLRAL